MTKHTLLDGRVAPSRSSRDAGFDDSVILRDWSIADPLSEQKLRGTLEAVAAETGGVAYIYAETTQNRPRDRQCWDCDLCVVIDFTMGMVMRGLEALAATDDSA